jgi:hypothetical protein
MRACPSIGVTSRVVRTPDQRERLALKMMERDWIGPAANGV